MAAVLSFQHLRSYPLHDDGVTWLNEARPQGNAVVAGYIAPGGSGDNAGIRVGDQLVEIGTTPIHQSLDVPQALWNIPLLGQTRYTLRRHGIEFQKGPIYVQAASRDTAIYYQYLVGSFYLFIGLFVYYRRTSAAKSQHFYFLCLASFIASCFHYSGKLNTFDEVIYWGNLTGSLFAPAIFLHFCLTFRHTPGWLQRRGAWLVLYLPSALLLAAIAASAEGILKFHSPLFEVRWLLDRATLGYSVLLYLFGAIALAVDYQRTEDPMARRQIKYLRNGAFVGLAPFALLYALPYTAGLIPNHLMNLSVLSLGLIPLTWAYAITRYRLMDVDIIFQQGYVYTLATLAVIGTFYGLIFLSLNIRTITPAAFVVVVSIATFVFQPIRRWIQEQLDRWVFYRDRYDARLTLIEFARELSSETDQNAMLAKVSDRLRRTLSIQQIGFFLLEEASGAFQLHSLTQKAGRPTKSPVHRLDLRFLQESSERPYLFFEQPKHLRDIVSQGWPASVRETIAELDFTYYVACKSRGRTIALSRRKPHDRRRLSFKRRRGAAGHARRLRRHRHRESRLYRSLQRKAEEYERLKEFSENIVESINVGILAARSGRPRGKLEHADRALDRHSAAGSCGPPLGRAVSRRSVRAVRPSARRGAAFTTSTRLRCWRRALPAGGGQLEAIPSGRNGLEWRDRLRLAANRSEYGDRAAGLERLEQIGRLIIFDDITDRDELERRLVQADKLELHRTAGGGRGARSEHAAGGDFHLRADAGEADFRATSRNRSCWKRSPSRLSAPARSSIRC